MGQKPLCWQEKKERNKNPNTPWQNLHQSLGFGTRKLRAAAPSDRQGADQPREARGHAQLLAAREDRGGDDLPKPDPSGRGRG